MTATLVQTSNPEHRFPVRRVDFSSMLEQIDRGFMADGDVVLSHLLATLSGVFPDGEEMFVTSVRHYRDQIEDPNLLAQVNAFIGQEATHGREHRDLNARFAAIGYRSQIVERMTADPAEMGPVGRTAIKAMVRLGIVTPDENMGAAKPNPLHMLALTAALEHYTATLAEMLLTEPKAQAFFTNDELFRMWAWHAMEECEHKAVAFDVYRAVGGDEDTRRRAMREARLGLTLLTVYNVVIGVAKDPATYKRGGLLTSMRRLRNNPLTTRKVWRQLKDYGSPDFHPLQHDTTAIEAAWRDWFDQGGSRAEVPTATLAN